MKEKWKFGPLFLFYCLVILLVSGNTLVHDESRYLMYAQNLSQGQYSPFPHIRLWNGPGYPLILMPFVLFNMPLMSMRLLNALFFFGAGLYFYATLRLYLDKRPALFFSYLFGLFPSFFGDLHLIITETTAIFLVCGLMYYFCKSIQSNQNFSISMILTGFFLGYLALTKIFFGPLIMVSLSLSIICVLWKRSANFKKILLINVLALLVCLPYLFYTYSLTGKIFYWGDSGGLSLYSMSTPYQEELGDWFGQIKIDKNLPWAQNHKSFFENLSKLSSVQQDEILKKQAIQNIILNPKKYLINWSANVGRLLFNYPYSYTPQKLSTFAYMIPNMFLVVMMIFSIYPTFLGRKRIPYEIYCLLLFVCLAFVGSSLLSAYSRQFLPLIPVFVLWIFFVWSKIMRVEMRRQVI